MPDKHKTQANTSKQAEVIYQSAPSEPDDDDSEDADDGDDEADTSG